MYYKGSKKNNIESMSGGEGGQAFLNKGGQAYLLKRVLEDTLSRECVEFKEDFDYSLEQQWSLLESKKGSFWQHYFLSGQKAIKYIDLVEPVPEGIHSDYSIDSFLLRRHHHCHTGTFSFVLELPPTLHPGATFGFALGVV